MNNNMESENKAKKITSDDVFKTIGEFGKYQFLIFCLVGLTCTINGISAYLSVFTEATPQYRCKLPNLGNDTYEITSPEHQELVDLYIPIDSLLNTYKGCTIRSEASLNASEVACNSWVYSKEFHERTLVTDWDSVCQNLEGKSLYQSLYFAGTFSIIFIGFLADRFGRKTVTFVFIVINAVAFLLNTLSVNFITDEKTGKALYATTRFLVGFFANFFEIATVLAVEIVGPNYRVMANNFMYYFYILGEFAVLFVAYFVRDHRYFMIVVTVLAALLITYFWIVPESARFLIGRKQYDKADAIFRRIAESNKREYPYSAATFDTEDANKQEKKVGYKVFVTNWKVLGRTIVFLLNWFTTSVVYYGISLNLGVLGGDPYLNFLFSAIVELAGVISSQFILDRLGRKIPYSTSSLVIAVSLIAIGFVPLNISWLIIVLVLIAKFCIAINYNAIYVITTESYPTVIRNSALAICSTAARIGSTISPYVALLSARWTPLPFVIYGALAAAAGLSYFLFMPETKDIDLPENLSDIVDSDSVESIDLDDISQRY